MTRFLKTKSLYYNDVNLIASKGKVVSRKQVPKNLDRIMVAPMSSVVGRTFAFKAAELGLSIILHRFCSTEDQAKLFTEIREISPHIWCAIGLKEPERMKALMDAGCKKFLLDVANGYSETTLEFLKEMSSNRELESIMAGNIHTASGYNLISHALQGSEATTYVRVGIGNGAACLTTKEVTGFGRGQISEILECHEHQVEVDNPLQIIADGGIRNAADASKAFGAGAQYVMMGSFFARAEEAETHVLGDGTYWGGASIKQQELFGGVRRHAEGTVLKIQSQPLPLEQLVEDLWMSLASAVSYSGKRSLDEFIGEGVFEIKFGGSK